MIYIIALFHIFCAIGFRASECFWPKCLLMRRHMSSNTRMIEFSRNRYSIETIYSHNSVFAGNEYQFYFILFFFFLSEYVSAKIITYTRVVDNQITIIKYKFYSNWNPSLN